MSKSVSSLLLAVIGLSCSIAVSMWVLGALNAPEFMYFIYFCGMLAVIGGVVAKEIES